MLGSRVPPAGGGFTPREDDFRTEARRLVAARFLLAEDVELVVGQALADSAPAT
jgi:hypothetical protein